MMIIMMMMDGDDDEALRNSGSILRVIWRCELRERREKAKTPAIFYYYFDGIIKCFAEREMLARTLWWPF